jgi:5-(carboxyamino)imidazole ribonucleotide synthase
MVAPAILPGARAAPHPATLGVLGGGQLGRMFVQAAQRMGYVTVVLDADPASPAGLIAHHQVQADYLDPAGLAEMVQRCDAITTEFENVPASALERLARQRPVAPGAAAVAVCQDRAAEKAHFARCGVACAPNAPIEDEAQLTSIDAALLPGILKTARLGYDGKGQRRVASREELGAAWHELGGVPCVLEALVPIAFELSVIVARDADDRVVHLPVQRNLHRDGILAVTEVPARGIGEPLQRQAIAAAERLARSLGYVGVLCVEFFVQSGGTLVANEMAPRPHNSGHYSIDACDVSQFELQVRTLVGLPLAQPRLHSPCLMLNLLGDLWQADGVERAPPWDALLALPGVHLHLYGKLAPRPGRKIGHLTVTGASAEAVRATARQAASRLGLALDDGAFR